MAGGRSPTGRGTNTEGTPLAEPEPGRESEPGRGREAPSWAVGPETRTRPDAGTAPGPTVAASRSAVISEPGTSAVSRSVGIGAAGTFAPPRPAGTSAVRQGRWREAGTALRDRLPLWVQLRCGLEPRALIALAVVLAGAAVLATTHFWSARPEAVRAPERVAEAAAVQPAGSGASGAQGPGTSSGPSAGSSAPSAQGGRIVVDVSGKVRLPGIQHLPAGSRVADALNAAGGVREGADLTGLNRARVLTDGEQVLVGLPAAQPPPGGGSPGTGQAGPSAPLSLGTATVEQLETLPGVGPVLAQHILDYRTEHGGYRSVDELREVNGIGDRRFADLRALVTP
ncbi:ComEA family DNA-binding protein [Streptomyces sp. NPDC049970]|uniref:ComEA family DNA-binding protein n=1 Tax=Streptomyces sp. NPDC049970 TaxID=3155033 RepID=UPI0034211BFD